MIITGTILGILLMSGISSGTWHENPKEGCIHYIDLLSTWKCLQQIHEDNKIIIKKLDRILCYEEHKQTSPYRYENYTSWESPLSANTYQELNNLCP